MEQELEIDTPCSSKESSREVTLFSVYLDELFPYALMWGMTPTQYWYEDSSLASAYRDKFDLERKLENQKLWFQGAYLCGSMSGRTIVLTQTAETRALFNRAVPVKRQRAEGNGREKTRRGNSGVYEYIYGKSK